MKPFFELDGKRYEITRTRYLETEYKKLGETEAFTDEQQLSIGKFQQLQKDYQNILERLAVAESEYFDDICNEEKEKVYNKFKSLSSAKFDELVKWEIDHKDTSMANVQKLALQRGENLLILALAEQYFDFNNGKAKETWESYVDVIGVQKASEWVVYMLDALFGSGEDDPFLAKAKAMQQQKMEQRTGLAKVRK